jgi:hypothetical protein
MSQRDSVVVAGSLAQKPHQGGHTWQFLQYILGFKQLGWRVLFVDALEASMCRDKQGVPCRPEQSENLRYFLEVMEQFGLQEDFALLTDGGNHIIGQQRPAIAERVRRSAFLLNVMGFLRDEAILEQAPRRVFLDTDPGYGQMWQDLGLATMFCGHDCYVTIAENIGQPQCAIPPCDIDWLTWRQPVVLSQWPARPPAANGAFTSIGAWRGPYGPIEYRGTTYGQRAHEFRRFLELPRRTGERFEAALAIDTSDCRDMERLVASDWSITDPAMVAGSPFVYRDYVGRAKAELMVARNMYVQAQCGWFSERSICFLSSGRPVLAQDTDVRHLYPSGVGLILFDDLDEAVAGADAISGDYELHATAAREIAEAYFDSDQVIPQLIEKVLAPAAVGRSAS